ncbi:hypothetical protein HZS55_12000 [Halosimplex rubrum]|uniref:Uncharacterized protein n=1 Tax=Halosimplex rubrum TaxID=869889 RepID=A0A7D5TDA9_9EURY|nr:hypothetical protein [Halosimplex rubrum]QLH77976.1 hypothetical protein HZS55_12000 [Halosimplex rubrum]
MTLAADTREAVRRHPFLYDALRARVVNYTAVARFLDVEGETDAVVAALRRFAEDLPDYERPGDSPPVSMRSGLGEGDPADAVLAVGDLALVPDGGSLTAITAGGEADAAGLRQVLGRLETAEVSVEAAAAGGGSLVVVVGRRDGADAVRAVEDALAA